MLTAPQPTPYDLRFPLFGVPVRVHPLFWLVSVLLGWSTDLREVLSWVAVVFVSILLHEFGHALAIRYYGWRPEITLYSFGGLASYHPGYRPVYSSYTRDGESTRGQIIIALAGPAAGFALAAALFLVFFFLYPSVLVVCEAALFGTYGVDHLLHGLEAGVGWRPHDADWLAMDPLRSSIVLNLFYVNIFWGLVNLLPIYPLDGGRVSRELFLHYTLSDGLRFSLMLSVAAAAGMAVWGLTQREFFITVLFGLLAYSSYQTLSHGFGGGRPW